MRRAAAAVLGTIAGTTLLIGAKLGTTSPNALAAGDAAPAAAAESAGSGPVPAPVTAPSGAAPTAAAATRTGAPVGTTPAAGHTTAPGRAAPPTPTPGTTTPATSTLKNGTFTGPAVSERYGTITVSVTVSGGRITDASGSCACSGESQQISSGAFGRLRQETLAAQSAAIATVSGATYTSGAYKSSLQAAIAAAHA